MIDRLIPGIHLYGHEWLPFIQTHIEGVLLFDEQNNLLITLLSFIRNNIGKDIANSFGTENIRALFTSYYK